jgi:hypothetical protein
MKSTQSHERQTTLGSCYQFAMSSSTTQVTPRGVAVGPLNDVAVSPLKDLACLDGVATAVVAHLEPGATEGTVAQSDLDTVVCEDVIDSVTNKIGDNLAQPVFVTYR